MTDEDAIRNSTARFGPDLGSRRFVEWSETFTDDGVFHMLNGRAAILQMIQSAELATKPDWAANTR